MKLAAVLLLVFVTCAFAPPDGAREWTPPEDYREIWKEAEACTGKRGNFDRIQWMQIPGRSFDCDGKGISDIGCWQKPHTITIASDWVNIRWVAKHEMIHDLTGYRHDGGPRDIQIWGKQCHAMWGYLDTDSTYKP
jgi:hypothetical protein